MYDNVHGKLKTAPAGASATEVDLLEDIKTIRDEDKKNILLRGLLPKIRDELWPRLGDKDPYDTICIPRKFSASMLTNHSWSLLAIC